MSIDTALTVSPQAAPPWTARPQWRVDRVGPITFGDPPAQPDRSRSRVFSRGENADQGSALRNAVVRQYVRMAQQRGTGVEPAVAGGPVAESDGVTNLQRDMLHAFIDRMGGSERSVTAGAYLSARV